MDQQMILVGGLIALAVGAVIMLVMTPGDKDRAKKRVSGLQSQRVTTANSAGKAAANPDAAKDRRKKLTETLKKIDDNQKETKKKNKASLPQKLEQSGMEITVKQFYIASLFSCLALVAVGLISGQKMWVTGLMGFVGLFGLPRWFVGMATKRRQKKFINEFSNAIDVIVRGVKSGLPVNECLKIIATESPEPVATEFHLLTEGTRVGMSLEQSLARMYERMPIQEVNFFAIVLMIQQKTGGNLAEALGNLALVLRGRKTMEGKVKALSAEAKASAYIIGALPFLVAGAVHMSSPDYLQPLFTTTNGNFILLGAGFWMACGIFIMRKMIAIKV